MAKKSSRMRLLLSGALSAVMLATLVPSTASAIGRTDTGSFLTGPYLMTPKTNGMVVVWELDKPMKSTITYERCGQENARGSGRGGRKV